MCLTADPGVASLITAKSHTFVEIDHVILPSSADSIRVVVNYKRKYTVCAHSSSLLDNGLVQFVQEKVWLGELAVPTWT